jgi:hypothetical protein
VPHHFDRGTRKIVQELDVKVGGNHPTGAPDRGSQPPRDASRTGANLQAVPARRYPHTGQMPDGDWVELRRQAG